MIKNLPTMQETCVQSLGPEDPLEKGIATHSRGAWWATVQRVAKSQTRLERLSTHVWHIQVYLYSLLK